MNAPRSKLIPMSLLICWSLYSGFMFAQLWQAFAPSQDSPPVALMVDIAVAFAAGVALLVYYGMRVSWSRAFLLAVGGSFGGWMVFAVFDTMFGAAILSGLGFIGWPVCLYIAYWNMYRSFLEHAL